MALILRRIFNNLSKFLPQFEPGFERGAKQVFTENINNATLTTRIVSKDNQIVVKNSNYSKLENGSVSRLRIVARGLIGKSYISNNLHLIKKIASATRLVFTRRFPLSTPIFALLGFTVAGPRYNEQQMEQQKLVVSLQSLLKICHNKLEKDNAASEISCSCDTTNSYKVGPRLGSRSCCSAVYATKCSCGKEYAMKMMFNYGNSKDDFIRKNFLREYCLLSPLPVTRVDEMESSKNSQSRILVHPNIIRLDKVIIDEIQYCDDAMHEYPDALPPSPLNPSGLGRHRTMFLFMKKYDMTLREYVHSKGIIPNDEATMLLLQLLQGVDYLNKNYIAHRDLKSDNILIEEVDPYPLLAITDFGECLDDTALKLVVPYISNCIDRGGNSSLMAPEIKNAEPGHNSVLDYRRSDVWAIGCLAFEIFGQENPFLNTFDSSSYQEYELPELPSRVPLIVRKIVRNLLRKDSSNRLPASLAIAALSFWRWGPINWRALMMYETGLSNLNEEDIQRWLSETAFQLSIQIMQCQAHGHKLTPELQAKYHFLVSTSAADIKLAVESLYC
ncbi:Serine/threonine-protein kinase PINK1, mitochondrial [Trichoplax sp. H2]|nr:Serine/threonine-protein kinase PINK1, mitochondrial [Trichoplax sp. H2]|eukprot:RDD43427.1 Serine/threonine-protein kinase PINK1, mitochondrial [Trichoplax sp. H2]